MTTTTTLLDALKTSVKKDELRVAAVQTKVTKLTETLTAMAKALAHAHGLSHQEYLAVLMFMNGTCVECIAEATDTPEWAVYRLLESEDAQSFIDVVNEIGIG